MYLGSISISASRKWLEGSLARMVTSISERYLANKHSPELRSVQSELLWNVGGDALFEAIGEELWLVALVVCVIALFVMIYRAWFDSERYRLDEKVV